MLRIGDVLLESFGPAPGLLLQREQPHVDAEQSLRELVLELAADRFAVVLLRRQNPVRQPTQPFLELEGLVETLLVQHPPLLVGFLHGLAPRVADFALVDGGGECVRARAQSGFQADEVSLSASRRALLLRQGEICRGKEYPGLRGVTRLCPGQRPGREQSADNLFVQAGEVERLPAEGDRPASQAVGQAHAGVAVPPQVSAQRGSIALG